MNTSLRHWMLVLQAFAATAISLLTRYNDIETSWKARQADLLPVPTMELTA